MSFNFAENLISADIAGLESGAASYASSATDTAAAGAQSQAAGLPVTSPGAPGDVHSTACVASIKACTSHFASHLADAGEMQNLYSDSIHNAATTYTLADQLGAAGVSTASAAAPTGLV